MKFPRGNRLPTHLYISVIRSCINVRRLAQCCLRVNNTAQVIPVERRKNKKE